MKIVEGVVKTNELIAKNVYQMTIEMDSSDLTKPGQFINIQLPNKYLRRPISVCDYQDNLVTIIYKVVGEGTRQLSQMKTLERLNILSGLGNGFKVKKQPALLIGGGVGVPPLYYLAKELIKNQQEVSCVLGFTSSSDCFYLEKFEELGCKVYCSTNDGSKGTKGFVSDIIEQNQLKDLYYYSCGPLPMLKAIHKIMRNGGQLSLEERMGCGFGACMGCSIKTKTGYQRVCKEGPVFESEELLWED